MSNLTSTLAAFVAVLVIAVSLVVSAPNPSNPVKSTCEPLTSKPDVQVKTYNFSTCILLRMGAYFVTDKNEYFNLKDGVIGAKSSCGNNLHKLLLDFECASLVITFGTSENSTNVHSFSGTYQINDTVKTFTSPPEASYFNTSAIANYYKCDAEQNITMNGSGSLFVSNFAFEVARDTASRDFYRTPEVCSADGGWSVSSLLLLAGLVAIMVVGAVYCVRYRKNSGSAY